MAVQDRSDGHPVLVDQAGQVTGEGAAKYLSTRTIRRGSFHVI